MMKRFISILLLTAIFYSSCTDSPFFDDDNTAKDRHVISGTVTLSDGSPPANAYVWIQDLGISARCSNKGEFSLQIPRTVEFDGLNGAYTIFFYVGNYRYQTAGVVIRDGLFEYGQHNITSEGKLDRTIVLSKLLDIKSSIRPDTISAENNFGFTLILEIVNIDSFVPIITQMDRERNMRGYFLKSLDSDSPARLLYSHVGTNPAGYTIDSMTVWETVDSFTAGFLDPGAYEMIPYIQVIQPGLPEELLLSLGEKANQYALDFLNVPYSRTHAKFFIN